MPHLASQLAGTASPVIALGSYRLVHNTTVLLTGHANGELRLHTLLAQSGAQRRTGSGWEDAAADGQLPSVSLLEAFQPEALLCGTPAAAACGRSSDGSGAGSGGPQACAASPGCAPIMSVHSVARGGMAAATIVAADGYGRLAVLKHGGPTGLGGEFTCASATSALAARSMPMLLTAAVPTKIVSACHCALPSPSICFPLPLPAVRVVRRANLEQVPTAVRPSGNTAAVLGSSGTASQQLSLPAATAPHESAGAGQQSQKAEVPEEEAGSAAGSVQSPAFKSCRGLGGSSIVAAAFDGQHPNRAYAVATNGSLLALIVGGERGTQSGCTVRSWAPLPADLLPVQQPSSGSNSGGGTASSSESQQQPQQAVQLAVLPGYLLMAAGGQLAVWNVTAAPRSPPRLLLRQPLTALAQRFGVAPAAAVQGAQPAPAPLLVASRQGRHVAFMLNATVLAIYQAAFPHQALRQPNQGALAWMQVGRWAVALFAVLGVCMPAVCRVAESTLWSAKPTVVLCVAHAACTIPSRRQHALNAIPNDLSLCRCCSRWPWWAWQLWCWPKRALGAAAATPQTLVWAWAGAAGQLATLACASLSDCCR